MSYESGKRLAQASSLWAHMSPCTATCSQSILCLSKKWGLSSQCESWQLFFNSVFRRLPKYRSHIWQSAFCIQLAGHHRKLACRCLSSGSCVFPASSGEQVSCLPLPRSSLLRHHSFSGVLELASEASLDQKFHRLLCLLRIQV